jgi:hypothetical protein
MFVCNDILHSETNVKHFFRKCKFFFHAKAQSRKAAKEIEKEMRSFAAFLLCALA